MVGTFFICSVDFLERPEKNMWKQNEEKQQRLMNFELFGGSHYKKQHLCCSVGKVFLNISSAQFLKSQDLQGSRVSIFYFRSQEIKSNRARILLW